MRGRGREADYSLLGITNHPGCGKGGFLVQSYEHIRDRLGHDAAAAQLETLKPRTFWGGEKESLIYPIALASRPGKSRTRCMI